MAGKMIAVLGGGVGGLMAANTLRHLLPRQHRVVLIEKDHRHAFAPSFLWLMVGARREDQIVRDLRTLIVPGVELVGAEVSNIDLANRRVETTGQPIGYDYLILALGAEYAPDAVPGLDPTAHTFYTVSGAARLQQALQAFPEGEGRVAVAVCGMPYKCPAAPYEGAMLIADYFHRRGRGRRVEVHLYTPEPQPMPVAGPTLGGAVQEMLSARGVVFHPLHKVTAVDGPAKRLQFEGREPAGCDLLVTVPPHRSPRVVREAGLTNDAGWVPVDRATLRTGHEHVYAVGDVTAIPIPGRWKADVPLLLPKAGVFAHAQGEVVARRIAAELTGARPADFDGYGYCMLEAGGGIAGMAFGNFFAEPSPQVRLGRPGQVWHWGKVLFEQWWLTPMGARRNALRAAMVLGARSLGLRAVA
ncbi:MAG TPA: FAD/NAD(P)-binding oxidoreductase [bacterium]|nr:FAD/NAD(P)-binding oxidoreductase [bacterium]